MRNAGENQRGKEGIESCKRIYREQETSRETIEMERSCEVESHHAVLPGFRFYPTDEELVNFFLRRKEERKDSPLELIIELDIYKFDPWDLAWTMQLGESKSDMYFFCKRDLKYSNSNRLNRITVSGFWKATGTDRPIFSADGLKLIGFKKSLVFYKGRASNGIKTDWLMHEFRRPTESDCSESCIKQNTQNQIHKETTAQHISDLKWVLCRILKKKTRRNSNLISALPLGAPSTSPRHKNMFPLATEVCGTTLWRRQVSKPEDCSLISSAAEKPPACQDVISECEPNLASLNYTYASTSYDNFPEMLGLQQQEILSQEEDIMENMNMFSCPPTSPVW